jgi:hypothetical protein
MTKRTSGLTTSQQCALSDMGIEVWVRRQPAGQAPLPAEDTVVAPPGAGRPQPRGGDAATPVNRAPVLARDPPKAVDDGDFRTELDCLAAAGVVIVGRWHSPLDRRLANDVVLAIALAHDPAMVQPAKVQQTVFRWPATQTGDRSIAAASNAFKAFLRGQAERAHARCVVLFGDAAATLADDAEAAVPRVVRQPAIGGLRADPNAKKALWLNVSQNVPG